MDSMVVSLVARLISVQAELGPGAYRRAVSAAYQAVARVAMEEAESQAGVVRLGSSPAKVVTFPLAVACDPARRRPSGDGR
ncbi:hypothetical protein [Bosea sp. (in: a-proteobacteria)]|uniref:hypothetical protein n=1 Tax=Bosea sp. (in: a-proteobacteria) TaxID=1871050 RepID=UPI00261CFAC3|nr:hypothetical protein [Bosea sp. (in: a-proteobacteria)]MCO5091705.1 hypothetical protein [Bosea sp. (in: a-proteobacteria)]